MTITTILALAILAPVALGLASAYIASHGAHRVPNTDLCPQCEQGTISPTSGYRVCISCIREIIGL